MRSPLLLKMLMMLMTLPSCLLYSSEEADTWQPHAHPASVERRLTAFTRPVAQMELASEVAGRIIAIPVTAGARIDDDTAVVQLDSSLAEAEYASASASLQEAQAQVEQVRAEQVLAERELQWWQQELLRVQTLVADDRAPAREADELRYRRDSARLRVEAMNPRLQAAEAAQERAQANRAQAAWRRDQHTLHAPSGWLVAERRLEEGSIASPGQAVLVLVDVRQLELPLALSAEELQALSNTDEIRVDIAGSHHPATLQRIDPRFDPSSRKRSVWLRLDASDLPQAGGGMEAVIRLQLVESNGNVRIPQRFVHQDRDQWLVFDESGTRHSIQPLRQAAEWLIVDGSSLPADITLQLPPRRDE